MSTVRELLTDSLQLLNIVAVGESVSPEQMNSALRTANDMLSIWTLKSTLVFHMPRMIFPLTPNKGVYTLGPGGDWDMPRPDKVDSAAFRESASGQLLERPVFLQTDLEYRSLHRRQTQSTWVTLMYLDDAYPLINASLYPVPTTAAEIILYPWEPLTKFSNLDMEIEYPTGYEAAIKYNLAIWIAPAYEITVSREITEVARVSKNALENNNTPIEELQCDPRLFYQRMGRYDRVARTYY